MNSERERELKPRYAARDYCAGGSIQAEDTTGTYNGHAGGLTKHTPSGCVSGASDGQGVRHGSHRRRTRLSLALAAAHQLADPKPHGVMPGRISIPFTATAVTARQMN